MPQASDTYLEALPPEDIARPAHSRGHFLKRALIVVLILFVLGWTAAAGISLAIQHTRLNGILTARIAASFGRPVEVGGYDFTFWGGPTIEAQSVTVAEDPRFGPEYFLRAESMNVGLRWESLLRGRIDLGTLALVRPSLNIVRNSDGEWNLAEWLPPAAGGAASGSAPVMPSTSSPPSALRFSRIEVQEGRINFKRGDNKLPMALIDVTGAVETNGPGRWRMDFDADPWRAAIVLQQMGVIHVSGDVGGTSSRLRPAALDVSWTNTSIPDVLRLAFGGDDGIRGDLALAFNARTRSQDDGWDIQQRTQLSQIHRWDLALRADNPSVNLISNMEWQPAASSLELTSVTLEAPHSSARGSGRIFWNSPTLPRAEKIPPVQFTVAESQVDVGDVLAWVRAFHPGVADEISAHGLASIQADASGWPLRLVDAAVSSAGADLYGFAVRTPAHLGEVQLTYDRGVVSFRPVALSWSGAASPAPGSAAAGMPEALFRMDLATKLGRNGGSTWHIAGSTGEVRDLIAGASALGWNVSRGWDLAGEFACDLRGPADFGRWPAIDSQQTAGWMEFGGSDAGVGVAALNASFLNRPIAQIKARAEWKPGSRHIALASAQAFGAHWSGTFDRHDSAASDWQFSLSADRVVAADLDRWLNPRWRESFLGRILPFLNSQGSAGAVPENLRATGHLSLGQFTLEPYDVRRLDTDVKISGRHIELANASGQFYAGTIEGSMEMGLGPAPSYDADMDFSRVDVGSLSAEFPALAGQFRGLASGSISFKAQGATRSDLLSTLDCQGAAQVANPALLSIDLGASLRNGAYHAGSDQFANASVAFTCGRRMIEFQTLKFVRSATTIQGAGTVDFSRNLDLRLQTASAPSAEPVPVFHITGTVSAPQVAPASAALRRSR